LGRVVEVNDKRGKTVFYYNEFGNIIKKTDELGKNTYFEYNPYGDVKKIRDDFGNSTEYEFFPTGEIKAVFENGKTYSIDVAYVLGTINYERIANNECWSVDFAEHKMTYDANTGIWTKTYTNLPAGDYQFKLYCGDWLNTVNVDSVNSTPGFKYDNLGDNISFTLSDVTTVTITYNSMLNTFAIVGQGIDKFGELVVTSYTLCGSKAIFGGEKDFDETLTANDMTEQDGVWTKTYEAVQLEAYNEETEEGVIYEYKVAANHKWNGAAYPSADVRVVFWVAEEGKYNLTFTYNPNAEGFKLNHIVEKVNEGTTTEVENAIVANVYTQDGLVVAEGEFQIYTVTGQNVTDMNGNLANGVYVVRTTNAVAKVVVR
jgi:YD repeat-containing protein